MRIALLSWEALHGMRVGGIAVHVSELAEALHRRGLDVHVFTRSAHPQQCSYALVEGVHYHRCTVPQSTDLLAQTAAMSGAFCHALDVAEARWGRFDVVHGHDWLAVAALLEMAESRSIATVFTCHSTEFGRCGNSYENGYSASKARWEQLGSQAADAVIAVSRSLRDEMSRLYRLPEDSIDVIYNGVSFWRYGRPADEAAVKARYGMAAHEPMVLFVGRLVYQKGPDLLLAALPDVLNAFPEVKFVFVGSGDLAASVAAEAQRRGIGHATRFPGNVDHRQLEDLYGACDCVCVPSRNEPFGIVLLEAWSAGKPVVASANGGPAEIVWPEVNGLVVPPLPDEIAQALKAVLADPSWRRWLGRNGRTTAETVFSWDRVGDRVLQVYDEILA